MVFPVPGHHITTAYGVAGSWSCGFHTGIDIAAPLGTPIVATIKGQVRHRDYGNDLGEHQFALSPDPGMPFGDGEVFYAHTSDRPPDGIWVNPGDLVAHVGNEGRSSGPHLHYEWHPSCKSCWCCTCCANPQQTLDHQSGGGGGGSVDTGGPYVTADVYSNKCGYGEPTNGDAESDTVKELRSRLDRVTLAGGQTLGPSPGVYDMEVDEEVRLWQEQIVHDAPDPAGASYLGPNQFAAMFPSPPYTRHDAGLPAVAGGGGGNGGGPGTGDPGGGGGGTGPAVPSPEVMLPGAVWEPITNFPGLRPFTGTAKKITLHTTETSVKPNWEQQQKGIPHLTVDLSTGERWQHLDFNIAAYTLNGGDHSPNSDSGQNIQIEIIGYTRDCPDWSYDIYDELAEILLWLSDNLNIPYVFPFAFAAPARQAWSHWESAHGVMGHCHAPYNDHSDPAGLRTDLLVGGTPPDVETPPTGDYVARAEYEQLVEVIASKLEELVIELRSL